MLAARIQRPSAAGLSRPHTSSRRAVLAVQAAQRDTNAGSIVSKAATVVLSAGLALGLALSSPPAATALPFARPTLAEVRVEKETELAAQLQKMEAALKQEETAAKAQIVGKRQALESTVNQVEVAIQRKLIEEAANEQAAAKSGDLARAARIEAEAVKIKEQEREFKVAAVKAEASIEREAFVEKAREAAAEQAIVKQAGGSMMDLLGISSKDLGL